MKIKFVFVSILFFIPFLLLSQTKNKQPTKYNVLFIAVDDLRPELNCYGANEIKSPNIDRLASNGILFTKAYVQQAICMASRASIMTGLRPETKGIYTGEPVKDLVPDVTTLNQMFEQNGYSISAYGKIYHHSSDHKNQFGKRWLDATDKWYGKGYLNKESELNMQLNVQLKGKSVAVKAQPFEWADVPDNAYQDGYNTEVALKNLEQFKEEGKPFFMAVGFHKPHLPFTAPKKYWDMYPIENISLPEITEAPENSNKYTLRPWGELRSYYGIPKDPNPVSRDTTLILRRGYYACISYVDALIGKLTNKLEKLGLADNTIIVLFGDHGYKLGDYGYWCKWSNMNIDTNIPLIINVPGGKKGKRNNVPVEALDIYPTLAELCGLEIPKHVEGKSLVNLIENPELEMEDYVYSVWPHYRTKYAKTVMGYAVKTSRFNYVEWIKLSTGEILAKELYDHSIDPKETKNIIGNDTYAETVKLLASKVKERKDATDHDHASKF